MARAHCAGSLGQVWDSMPVQPLRATGSQIGTTDFGIAVFLWHRDLAISTNASFFNDELVSSRLTQTEFANAEAVADAMISHQTQTVDPRIHRSRQLRQRLTQAHQIAALDRWMHLAALGDVRSAMIDPEKFGTHPQNNILIEAVGTGADFRVIYAGSDASRLACGSVGSLLSETLPREASEALASFGRSVMLTAYPIRRAFALPDTEGEDRITAQLALPLSGEVGRIDRLLLVLHFPDSLEASPQRDPKVEDALWKPRPDQPTSAALAPARSAAWRKAFMK